MTRFMNFRKFGNFGKLFRDKRVFLVRVYALLICQLLITAYTIWHLRKHPDAQQRLTRYWWVWVTLAVAILLALLFMPLPSHVKLVLVTLFSIVVGFLSTASNRRVDARVIQIAAIVASIVFVSMSVLGFALAASGIDLGFTWILLLMCLVALILLKFALIYVDEPTHVSRLVFMLGIVLFAAYIVYDTNAILQRSQRSQDSGSVIESAVAFYLDIIHLFTNLIGLDMIDAS